MYIYIYIDIDINMYMYIDIHKYIYIYILYIHIYREYIVGFRIHIYKASLQGNWNISKQYQTISNLLHNTCIEDMRPWAKKLASVLAA